MLEPSRAITECSKPLASVGPDRRCPKCFQALKKKSGAVVKLPQSLLSSLVDSSNVSNDCFTASAVSLLLLFHCFIWKWEWITRIQGSLENIEKFSSNTPWWLSLLKNYHWHLCTLCIILVFFTSFVISTSTWILRNPKKNKPRHTWAKRTCDQALTSPGCQPWQVDAWNIQQSRFCIFVLILWLHKKNAGDDFYYNLVEYM